MLGRIVFSLILTALSSVWIIILGTQLLLLSPCTGMKMRGGVRPVTVLPPLKWANRELALIIIPEEGVVSKAYKPLGRSIQRESPYRLWIGVVNVPDKASRVFQDLPMKIAYTLQRLNRRGMNTTDIFLGGHGNGGILAQLYARMVPDIIKGVILLSSFLSKVQGVTAFPVPVITISGDLDGVARITRVANSFQDVENSLSKDTNRRHKKHIVIIEGMNHRSVINKELPPELRQLDMRPEIKRRLARRIVGNYTKWFMVDVMQDLFSYMSLSQTMLREAYDRTKQLMQPILRANNLCRTEDYTSPWSRIAQIWLSGLRGPESQRLMVDSYVVGRNIPSNPTIQQYNGIVYVTTYTELYQQPPLGNDYGSRAQAPKELHVRLKTAESIQMYLHNVSLHHTLSCKDFNYGAYLAAYHDASAKARQRFNSYNRGIQFADDIVVDDEFEWEQRPLVVRMRSGEASVQSIAWKTPVDHKPSHLAGMYYCKLLPPSRVIEWIYVDALQERGHL